MAFLSPNVEDPEMRSESHYDINKNVATSSSTENSESQPFNQAATKRLLRKLDWHLIPILALIYMLCFLDRTNVGNARLVKLEVDLGMKGLDYNVALAIFFPFYVAAEIPSNMMLKRTRPSIWLTFIMLCWGLVMVCMGLVHNFSGLVACRVFLGIAEGGLFPGINYFITLWYRRRECGFRMALFFSAATAAGAFGGLLARGISEMDGVGGKAAWSWIFILEGLLTVLVASFGYWVIQDYPATAKFLTVSERVEVERRLAADSISTSNDFHLKYAGQALKDWKIWAMSLMAIGIFAPLYSISLFLPTIIKELGYTKNAAQLLTVPVYALACLCTITGSYFADKAGKRGVFLLGFEILAIVGFVVLISTDAPHVQYAGAFLAASGIFPSIPLLVAWNSNNIGGSLKRGVGIALQTGIANLGGVIASFVYLPKDEPRFIQGHAILIGTVSMSACVTIFMIIYLSRENSRRSALAREHGLVVANLSEEIVTSDGEMSEKESYFQYTV